MADVLEYPRHCRLRPPGVLSSIRREHPKRCILTHQLHPGAKLHEATNSSSARGATHHHATAIVPWHRPAAGHHRGRSPPGLPHASTPPPPGLPPRRATCSIAGPLPLPVTESSDRRCTTPSWGTLYLTFSIAAGPPCPRQCPAIPSPTHRPEKEENREEDAFVNNPLWFW
ncbi:hypothetical protein U9M48_042671 [Paspalum notatum var. saurae]|uniref:Uncharacterized protein n=1 Tax=Paspalum notatum var. saurae TaxID=547442 RepID=A0AAQ3UT22_PASNO